MQATKRVYNRREAEYIDELPENVIPINSYFAITLDRLVEFNRYWYDSINSRIIMKPKRGNKFKIVKPMNNKYHDCDFVYLFDIDDNRIWVNCKILMKQINNEVSI